MVPKSIGVWNILVENLYKCKNYIVYWKEVLKGKNDILGGKNQILDSFQEDKQNKSPNLSLVCISNSEQWITKHSLFALLWYSQFDTKESNYRVSMENLLNSNFGNERNNIFGIKLHKQVINDYNNLSWAEPSSAMLKFNVNWRIYFGVIHIYSLSKSYNKIEYEDLKLRFLPFF